MPDQHESRALRVALAQIDTCVGDLAGNTAAVLDRAREAAAAGADLVAFPEMTVTGYPIEDLALRASFRRGAEQALTDLAAALADAGLGGLTVVVGTVGERTTREHEGAPGPPTRPWCCATAGCSSATTSTTSRTTACSTSSGSSPPAASPRSSRSPAAASGC
jgi:predicted amidohydrolase